MKGEGHDINIAIVRDTRRDFVFSKTGNLGVFFNVDVFVTAHFSDKSTRDNIFPPHDGSPDV